MDIFAYMYEVSNVPQHLKRETKLAKTRIPKWSKNSNSKVFENLHLTSQCQNTNLLDTHIGYK